MSGYKPPYTLTSKILKLVSEIVENIALLNNTKLSSNILKLRKKNRIKTITGTLQIEGNTLSVEQVTAILEGRPVIGTIREIEEVRGAIEAYDRLEKYDPKSEKDLLKAHKLLMHRLLTKAGSYRSTNVGVGGKGGVTHIAPPHDNVPKLMNELFEWLGSSDEHPLVASCVFHYEFEFIHPFIDGNGRIGRLWQSVILSNYKSIFSVLPIENVVRENQKGYYTALEKSGSLGESTPFVEFMLDVILKTVKKAILEDKKVGKKVGDMVGDDLSENQEKILEYIRQNPKISASELSILVGISQRKIEENIKKLKTANILKRVGSPKSGHWVIEEQK